jgi:nitroreductase
VVDRILDNARHAPSAGNSQGWAFLVLEGADTARYWDAAFPDADRRARFRWPGLFRAPLLVVAFAHEQAYRDRYARPDKAPRRRAPAVWPVPFWFVDTGFAVLLMLLTAVDEGLGALFFRVHAPEAVRAAFGVPDAYAPVGTIAVGHPLADEPSPSVALGRRPAGDVIHRGRW